MIMLAESALATETSAKENNTTVGGDRIGGEVNHQNQQQHSNNNVHLVGDYRKESVVKILKSRIGWLSAFFLGLILAAVVVERFEELLTHEVELSYFVPLLIGHGGNTGSQSVATVIRAIALKQIKPENTREVLQVLFKEAVSGFIMGGFFGDVSVRVIAGVGRHIASDWFGGGDIVTFGERVGERVRRRVAAVRGEAGF